MSRQEPIHVVVEKRGGCFSGCGTALAVMVLLGLTIQYWYIALGLVAIAVVAAIVPSSKEREKARNRPGPRDPWLNEVAVALADLGLKEVARRTGTQLGGVSIDGDIGLEADRLAVYITLFSDQRGARQAELGLRAKPEVRDAVTKGATAINTVGRVVYVANGRGAVVDEFRLDEVVRLVTRLAVPPPLAVAQAGSGGHSAVGLPGPGTLRTRRTTCWSSCASLGNCATPACSPTRSSRRRRRSCSDASDVCEDRRTDVASDTHRIAVHEFCDDDAGYLRWVAANQDGYLINILRGLNPSTARLHQATCRTISGATLEAGPGTARTSRSALPICDSLSSGRTTTQAAGSPPAASATAGACEGRRDAATG